MSVTKTDPKRSHSPSGKEGRHGIWAKWRLRLGKNVVKFVAIKHAEVLELFQSHPCFGVPWAEQAVTRLLLRK